MTAKAMKVPLRETALTLKRITDIGQQLHPVRPDFDADAFVRDMMTDLPRLELKDRISRTSEAPHAHLPVTGPEALDVLLRSLPPTPEAAGTTNDFGWHTYSPHSDFVARYLRIGEYLDQALDALARFTRYVSAEVAVRDFLNHFPEETMKAVDAWSRDEDHRTRRLASEATRPSCPAPRCGAPCPRPALRRLQRLRPHLRRQRPPRPRRHAARTGPGHPPTVEGHPQHRRPALRLHRPDRPAEQTKKGSPDAYAFLGHPHDAPIELTPLVLERTELTDSDVLSSWSSTSRPPTSIPAPRTGSSSDCGTWPATGSCCW
uniref:Uncharacterized protein n=1 Tax=Streptomyces sp. NBC_00008 TaxID=2903610 RepID=A0AAU2VI10_9ACTN